MDANVRTDQRLATLRAQAALIRCALHANPDGSYVLTP